MRILALYVSIISLMLGSLFMGTAHAAPKHGGKVIFICSGNYYRSRFAQALFNATPPKGWTATSRGLDLSKKHRAPVSPLVITELQHRGLPTVLVDGTPTLLEQKDLDEASIVVLMNGAEHEPKLKAMFPGLSFGKVRSWAVEDVPKMTAPEAFGAITTQIDALLKELATK